MASFREWALGLLTVVQFLPRCFSHLWLCLFPCVHLVQATHCASPALQGLISLTTSPVIAAGIAGLATSATAHSAVEVLSWLLPLQFTLTRLHCTINVQCMAFFGMHPPAAYCVKCVSVLLQENTTFVKALLSSISCESA